MKTAFVLLVILYILLGMAWLRQPRVRQTPPMYDLKIIDTTHCAGCYKPKGGWL